MQTTGDTAAARSAGTTAQTAADRLVRVERGQANDEELAAITALLLARAAAGARHGRIGGAGDRAEHRPTKARWRRLERTPGFRAPHSWQG